MKITGVEMRTIRMPLKSPFETSFGVESERVAVLLRVIGSVAGPDQYPVDVQGWGECVAMEAPLYSSEYADGAADVLRRFLVPRLLGHVKDSGDVTAEQIDGLLAPIIGHRMAKAALEMAVLDAQLRSSGQSFAGYFGATRQRVPSGVSVGIQPSVAALLLIERPLAEDDICQHAELARLIRTPICLDESVVSVRAAADVIALRAAQVINIKAGRVGGYLNARRIHDLCRANGIPVWCGGMVETGLGRAANAALAALPGFTLPGDVSASDRFYEQDITTPFVLEDGEIIVPTGPGLGVEPIMEVLDSFTVSTEWLGQG